MKREYILTIFLIFMFICGFTEISYAQRWMQVATSDFKWEGEFWQKELGPFAADYFAQAFQMRRSSQFQSWNFLGLEMANKLLAEKEITQAFDADPRQITDIFWIRNIRIFFAGSIEKIIQTADVDGSAEVKIRLEIKMIDVRNGIGISTDWIEYKVHLDKKIKPGDPFDKNLARKILSGAFNRIETSLSNSLSRYQGIR